MRHRSYRAGVAPSRRRSALARKGSDREVYNVDNDWVMVPAFASGTFLLLGLALLYSESYREHPIPELDDHLDSVSVAKPTVCKLRLDVNAEPRCRQQYNHTEYLDTELLCFCSGFIWAKDSESEQPIEVFLGPNKTLHEDRQAWCAEALLQNPWPNIITYENVGTLHWACGVILDRDRKPCQTSGATRSHAHCSASFMYPDTKKHHRCLVTMQPGSELPCTRLDDGRLLIGPQDALVAQLGQHLTDFSEAKHLMLVFAGGFVGVAVLIVFLTILCWLGSKAFLRRRAKNAPKVEGTRIGRTYDVYADD